MKPTFHSTYNKKLKCYRIVETNMFGVKFIHSAFTKEKRELAREIFKRKNKLLLNKNIVTPQYVGFTSEAEYLKDHPQKRRPNEVSLIETFYKNLPDTFYYVIDTFWLTLYDENNDQNFLIDHQENDVPELQLAKFFIVEKKYKKKLVIQLESDDAVAMYKFRKITDNQYYLMVLPEFNFHDNRCGFYIRNFSKPITYSEVKRAWKNIDNYGFEKMFMPLLDIKKSHKILTKTGTARKIMIKKKKEFMEKLNVISQQTVELEAAYEIKRQEMKTKNSKHYRFQNTRR